MVTRALIVAIASYPNATGVGAALSGLIPGAKRFSEWLEEVLGVQAEDIVVCAGEESTSRNFADSIEGVRQAVTHLIEKGQDSTDRLIVYLAGHGVSVTNRGDEADYLLTSDFVDARQSGNCCISITGLSELLARTLGPGNHLWFVDSCRTLNVTLTPSGLGLNPQSSFAGEASRFSLFSTGTGLTAPNNSQFVDAALSAMNGNCRLVEDAKEAGVYRVGFQSVAESVSRELQSKGRETYVRTAGGKNDALIRTIQQPGQTSSIVRDDGIKSPPVKLLTDFDELIFLGETLGQPTDMVEQAFEHRSKRRGGNRRWKRLELFSLNDLSNAFRTDASLEQLDAERNKMEEYFKCRAAEQADSVRLYRYDYVGTYASFWRANDGRRRVHASSGLIGQDIRQSPATDYVDFPEAPLVTIDKYYSIITELKQHSNTCSLIFDYTRPNTDG